MSYCLLISYCGEDRSWRRTALTQSFLTRVRIAIKHTTGYVPNEILHGRIAFAGLTDPFQDGPFHLDRIITHVHSFLGNLGL